MAREYDEESSRRVRSARHENAHQGHNRIKNPQRLSSVRLLAVCLVVAQYFGSDARAQKAAADAATPSGDRPRLIVQLGHSDDVKSAAFSPDGRFIVTGGGDRTARLWDANTGAEIRRFSHPNFVTSAVFSPNGRYVLTGTGSYIKGEGTTAYLWDITTGEKVREFDAHSSINSIAFSPDGWSVLIGADDAQLFDRATAKLLRRFEGHTGEVSSVAFSPDGNLVLTGSWDHTARIWETATAQQVQKFDQPKKVNAVAFSPDGRFVLTGCDDRVARVWDTAGREIAQEFQAAGDPVNSVAFSPDGRFVAAASSIGQVWDRRSGQEVFHAASSFTSYIPHSVAFSPNGHLMLTGDGFGKSASVWEVITGKLALRFEGQASGVTSVAFSPDGRFIATGADATRLWDTVEAGEPRLIGPRGLTQSLAFSPDSRLLAAGGLGNDVRVFDASTGAEVQRFDRPGVGDDLFSDIITSLAFSPDGRYVVTGSADKTARKWELATGKEVLRINHRYRVNAVAFSSNGKFILTGSGDQSHESVSAIFKIGSSNPRDQEEVSTSALWDAGTGQLLRWYTNLSSVYSVSFSPGDDLILAGGLDAAWLYETGTAKPVGLMSTYFVGRPAVFSPGGSLIATGSGIFDSQARLYTPAGHLVRRFVGHSGGVTAVAFSPDRRLVLTGSSDGTSRLWDAETGKEVCQLISFRNGDWVVVDPQGRFDTNNLEGVRGLHWIMPDDPLRPLPLEIFMRDYYEPRLLARILNGERFEPIRPLTELNRVQPTVRISGIEQLRGKPDVVTVTVEVSKARGEFSEGGRKRAVETGVYDVRLFRNGQIVGESPEPKDEADVARVSKRRNQGEALRAWRHGTEVKLDEEGKRIIKFENINLPRDSDVKRIEFSAYAFNEDRVKSATSRRVFDASQEITPVKGRAYIVAVGVNAYENPDWNLSYAASDARLVQRVLLEKLSAGGEYREVVPISLISDYRLSDGMVLEKSATKENLKAVLELLSRRVGPADGKGMNRVLLKNTANVEKLRPARPEDLLIILISSHGEYENGSFYFLPYDIGAGKDQDVTDELLRHSISSEELSLWLRDIDAGEMVLIADACHSAATVEAEGFKPGPMGSRGLGQLAYDKGMRVLAASQANDAAREGYGLGKSLLTQALVCDGIEARRADYKPKDGRITLSEWLSYGVERVPKLHKEVEIGQAQAFNGGMCGRVAKTAISNKRGSLSKISMFQQPSLFNFARQGKDPVLVK